eukprot:7352951-Prymnesium_polylepis.1
MRALVACSERRAQPQKRAAMSGQDIARHGGGGARWWGTDPARTEEHVNAATGYHWHCARIGDVFDVPPAAQPMWLSEASPRWGQHDAWHMLWFRYLLVCMCACAE